METLRVAQGEDLSVPVQLRNERGVDVVGVYSGAETFDLDVWAGGRQAETALAASSASWSDADAGLVDLLVGRPDTASLSPGLWFLRLWITVGPLRLLAYEARLDVSPSAGSESSLPSYCTLADLYSRAPWIDQVIGANTHLRADLGEQRSHARERIDETILSRAAEALREQSERHAPVAASDPIVITDGVDAGPGWGASVYPDASIRDQLAAIQGHLAADKLMIDPRCRGAAVNLTLDLAFRPLLGSGPTGTPYQQLGRDCRAEAARMLRGWTARIDIDGDGIADMEIS